MKNIKKICVLGGDKRQRYIAEMLSEMGAEAVFEIGDISKEKFRTFDCFLLPIPVTKDGYRLNCEKNVMLMDIFEALPYDCLVIGGKIPQFFVDHLLSKNISVCDFYEDKEYIWKNAKITAEGALMLLMQENEFALEGFKVLICGYGRIGKCLSKMLGVLGADVTIGARKKEVLFEAAVCGGFKTDIIDPARSGLFDISRRYDVIFNTAPGTLFDENNTSMLENSIYIELAGVPYGGERELIGKYCKKYILASGIPGKYAARSDANAAFKVISRHIFGEESI